MHPLIPYFEPPAFELPIERANGQPLAIHGFGILVALGVMLGAQMAMRKCRRDGLDPEVINRVVTWIIVGIFVGGHLGHALFYEPEHYMKNPMELLRLWDGLSSYGGFIASAILVYVFFKRERKDFWAYGDTIAYGLTLGWGLGRMGCFVAHDHAGTETDFWLGVYGMCPDKPITVACHDLGLYEALYTLLFMLPLFVLFDRKPRFTGFFIGWLCLLYGPVRLFMDVFRSTATDARYFGFTPAQYGSVAVSLLGAWILYSRRNQPAVRQAAAPVEAPSGT